MKNQYLVLQIKDSAELSLQVILFQPLKHVNTETSKLFQSSAILVSLASGPRHGGAEASHAYIQFPNL